MTEVAFHFNAPDKLAYACRFARKAFNRGVRVVVTGGPTDLQALDRMMWALGPTDFVAHALADSRAALGTLCGSVGQPGVDSLGTRAPAPMVVLAGQTS